MFSSDPEIHPRPHFLLLCIRSGSGILLILQEVNYQLCTQTHTLGIGMGGDLVFAKPVSSNVNYSII